MSQALECCRARLAARTCEALYSNPLFAESDAGRGFTHLCRSARLENNGVKHSRRQERSNRRCDRRGPARSSGLRQRHEERGHKWLSTEPTLNRLEFDSCGREIFRIERDDNADRAATPEWNDYAIADRSVGSVEGEIVVEPLARRTWHIDRDAQDRSRRQRVRLSAPRHTEIRRSGCFARSARTIFST